MTVLSDQQRLLANRKASYLIVSSKLNMSWYPVSGRCRTGSAVGSVHAALTLHPPLRRAATMIGPGWFDRNESLRRLADDPFDVLVVGGGITGVGVALDAASRGLRTALIERDDFASGTSSKSSKLAHGGLRYLQQGEIRLVYEALHERQRLRHNAP
ncbi:MAG: FAD-dependent oxidoreductase, partial [Aquihabitans sp.]